MSGIATSRWARPKVFKAELEVICGFEGNLRMSMHPLRECFLLFRLSGQGWGGFEDSNDASHKRLRPSVTLVLKKRPNGARVSAAAFDRRASACHLYRLGDLEWRYRTKEDEDTRVWRLGEPLVVHEKRDLVTVVNFYTPTFKNTH